MSNEQLQLFCNVAIAISKTVTPVTDYISCCIAIKDNTVVAHYTDTPTTPVLINMLMHERIKDLQGCDIICTSDHNQNGENRFYVPFVSREIVAVLDRYNIRLYNRNGLISL